MTMITTDREGFAAFLLRMRAKGVDDRPLMAAFEAVPRRDFIRAEFSDSVWSSRMVPLDCGETLEGVDIQATIIRELEVASGHLVFELGTGSGFTAAVLSKLAKRIYTIERFRTLQESAAARFKQLKIDNIISLHGDASKGCTHGPFDRIVSWAAFEQVPRPFIELLASGGVMICPVGEADAEQDLVRLTKVGSRFEREDLLKIRTQPLNLKVPEVL